MRVGVDRRKQGMFWRLDLSTEKILGEECSEYRKPESIFLKIKGRTIKRKDLSTPSYNTTRPVEDRLRKGHTW